MVCRLGDMMSEYGSFTLWVWFILQTPTGEKPTKRVAVVRNFHCTRDEARQITNEYREQNPGFRGDLAGEWVMRDSF